VVPVAGAELALTGAAGAVSAAAVEEEAAMAAAAIASGAFGLLAAEAVAGVSASAAVTGITVAIAFGIAICVPPCCGAVAGSAEFAELLSVDALSVDLPPEDVEPDLALEGCPALDLSLAPAAAALESAACVALSVVLFEFAGGDAGLAGPASDDGRLAEVCDESLEERCGAAGSGAGGRELAVSACVLLLSTRAAKLSFACEGSGGANFGGALE
jgi:hypothetical protein